MWIGSKEEVRMFRACKIVEWFLAFCDYCRGRTSWHQLDLDAMLPQYATDRKMDPYIQAVANAIMVDCFCLKMHRLQRLKDKGYAPDNMYRSGMYLGTHTYAGRQFEYQIILEGDVDRGGKFEVIFVKAEPETWMKVRAVLMHTYGKSLISIPECRVKS